MRCCTINIKEDQGGGKFGIMLYRQPILIQDVADLFNKLKVIEKV